MAPVAFDDRDIEALVQACSSGLTQQGSELGYAEDALQVVADRFAALRRTAKVEEATRELLLFAFFLHTRKQSPSAAKALAEIADTAAASLRAQGRSIEHVLEHESASSRLKTLGLTARPQEPTTAGSALTLLDLLTGRRNDR